MAEGKLGHLTKLPIDAIKEVVSVKPQVECPKSEILGVLRDIKTEVDGRDYVPQAPTRDSPSLSDVYIFDTNDEELILKDLSSDNFVGKIIDVGKGAKKRLENGLPQEYLYVFKYPCKLQRRDADIDEDSDNVLIYIKINNRKVPYRKVIIVSFHKNRIK